MDSWWSLGEGRGRRGQTLDPFEITCPFCTERGNFTTAFHAIKKKPNSDKCLNFDTLECGNCKGYVMVLWSASEYGGDIYDYQVLPWPLKLDTWPKHWPDEVGRYWLQAKRNLHDGNWDACALMARSSLEVALRQKQAHGRTLKQEIDDLAAKGTLPPIMKDWSDHIRELGNDSAHPTPGVSPTDPRDAADVVGFLDFLLEYMYTVPHRIDEYRSRQRHP